MNNEARVSGNEPSTKRKRICCFFILKNQTCKSSKLKIKLKKCVTLPLQRNTAIKIRNTSK